MKTITDWRFVRYSKGFYVTGLCGGHNITTSHVVDYASVNNELVSIKTANGTVYHLHDVSPGFIPYANSLGADQFLPIPDYIMGLTPLQVPTHGVLNDERIIWSVEKLSNGTWKGYAVEDYHCLVRFTESSADTLEEARDTVIEKLRKRIAEASRSTLPAMLGRTISDG